MISNEQIAHDLAIAKITGSELPIKELCAKYDQYYNEALKCLSSETNNATSIVDSPL